MTPEQYFEYSKQNFNSLHDSLSELHGMIREHSEQVKEHSKQLEKDAEAIRALAGHADRMMDAIESLADIASAHERRIQDLEGGEQPQG